MILRELLSSIKIERIIGAADKDIEGIAYDSRLIKKGSLFVAVRGFSTDGHLYIKDAVNKGAAAVVVEKGLDLIIGESLESDTTFIEVIDSREALACLSSAFYGEPSRALSIIGITGTNGKTTTAYITKSILEAWGRKVGLLGTIRYIIGGKVIPSPHTTPESLDLQRYLREMLDEDAEYAVMEVSSHALALKRVYGCSFKVAVFTNFSQDHLDFHHTMDEYFAAKSMLFEGLAREDYAVLNWDDVKVRGLAEKLSCNVITCGLQEGAMIRAVDIRQNTEHRTQNTEHRTQNTDTAPHPPLSKGGEGGFRGLSFKVQTPRGEFFVDSPLVGRNNIYNILMAIGASYALGVSRDAIRRGVREIRPIEGRFERVDEGQKFLCIVDYAHTEDALKRLIEEARLITKGRVITVFGCGGDRDRTKRPHMGAVAAGLSEFAIITSDNPRTEEPLEIIGEIVKGIKQDNYKVVSDRREAIIMAVETASDDDTVLIAGKGHEDYQEIKGVRYHFSDREVLADAIKNLKLKMQN